MKAELERPTIRVEDLRGISHAEGKALAERQCTAMLELLRGLRPEEWTARTDCELWAVQDIVAHLCGWAEAVSSPREMIRQTRQIREQRSRFPTFLEAQNQVQVESRVSLGPAGLLARLELWAPRSLRARDRYGRFGKGIPFFYGAPLGATNLAYVMDVIFTRDWFMHRIDITRGTGRQLDLGESEARLIADMVRDWTRRFKPDMRLELTGPAGGSFVAGNGGRATATVDAVEFCRLQAGRADVSVVGIDGDRAAAERWLAQAAPF